MKQTQKSKESSPDSRHGPVLYIFIYNMYIILYILLEKNGLGRVISQILSGLLESSNSEVLQISKTHPINDFLLEIYFIISMRRMRLDFFPR